MANNGEFDPATRSRGVLALGVAAGAVILASNFYQPGGEADPQQAAAVAVAEGEAQTGIEAATVTTVVEQIKSPEVADRFVSELGVRFRGFGPGQLRVGSDVRRDQNPGERGAAAFSQEGACSAEEMKDFLTSGTPQSEAVAARIRRAFGDNDLEKQRKAMEGEGYVLVQAMTPVSITGTTYFEGGQVRKASMPRAAAAGDIFMLWVDDDSGEINWDASARCDCINPEIDLVTPTPPGSTPPPSIERPPSDVEDKFDDGVLPGDGTPASQDPGTPDVPGDGPAGQIPNNSGYLPGEVPPQPPTGGGDDGGDGGGGGGDRPPASTTPTRPTNPPVSAVSTTSTTEPSNVSTPTP